MLVDGSLELTDDRYSEKGRVVIRVGTEATAMNLSKRDRGCVSVEIGTCIKFIHENNLSKDTKHSLFSYDQKVSECQIYEKWVNKVRNTHMHVAPIESLQEAKEKLAKTAYWLLKIVEELG